MDKMNKEQYLVKLKEGLDNFRIVNAMALSQLLLIYFDSNLFLKVAPFMIFAGFIRHLFHQHIKYNLYDKYDEKEQIKYFIFLTVRICLLIFFPSWLIIIDSILLGILFFASSIILTVPLFVNKDNVDEIIEYINSNIEKGNK